MMCLRQIGGAVEYEHRPGVLELRDALARALYQQHVTGAQADHVEVAGYLRTRCTGAMQCKWQQTVTAGEARRRETAKV